MKKLTLTLAFSLLFSTPILAAEVSFTHINNAQSKIFGIEVDRFDGYAMGTGTEIFNSSNGTSSTNGSVNVLGYLYHTWMFNSTSTDAGNYTIKEYVQIGSSSTWVNISSTTLTGTSTLYGTPTVAMWKNYRIGVNKTGTTTGAVEVKDTHYNLYP